LATELKTGNIGGLPATPLIPFKECEGTALGFSGLDFMGRQLDTRKEFIWPG